MTKKCKEKEMAQATNFPINEVYYFSINEYISLNIGELVASLLAFTLSDYIIIDMIDHIRFYANRNDSAIQFVLKIQLLGKISMVLNLPDMVKLALRLPTIAWALHITKPNKTIQEIKTIEPLEVNEENLEWIYRNSLFDLQKQLKEKRIITKLGSTVTQNFRCQQQEVQCFLSDKATENNLTIEWVKCLKYFDDEKDQSILGSVKIVITYTGLSISAVSLVVSIVVYRITNLHRSIPGSIVHNLFISVFVTNIVFMAGIGANEYQITCYLIGVSLHYLLLLVFVFKSVGLLHMAHKFKSMSFNSTSGMLTERTHTKLKLTILCLALPLIFVVPGIVFNEYNVYDIRVEYNNQVCFPTDYLGNLIFVSIPVGLSVLTNMCCLGIVLGVLTQHSIKNRHVRKSTSYQLFTIYARIGVVTGIFWICGILGSLFRTVVTEFISITMCSFQGLFVSLAYISTKKVSHQLNKNAWVNSNSASSEKVGHFKIS